MKKCFAFFILLFTSVISVNAQEIILPDQIFTIKVIEKNGSGKTESMPPDELIFKSNQISADFSLKNGFPAANYTTASDEKTGPAAISFIGQSDNFKKHTIKWTGTKNGNKIQGKAQHYFFGKIAGEYLFTGTLKKKK